MRCEICKGFFKERQLKNYIQWIRRYVVFVQKGEKANETRIVKYCDECASQRSLDRI